MLIKLPKEFSWTNLGFKHSEPNDFVKSQWQKDSKSICYVVYRWIIASLFIINLTLSLLDMKDEHERNTWIIYLTRWGLLLNLFTSFLAATLVSLQNFNVQFQHKINGTKDLPRGIQIYWALHTIIVTLALLITLVYWTFVHNYTEIITVTNIFNHILNSGILIFDVFVVCHPHRVLHLIYVQFLVVIYAIFSFIYYKAGGVNAKGEQAIYPILDWNKVANTILYLIAVLFVISVLHMVVHGIYRLRVWSDKNRKKNNDNNTMVLTQTPKESVTIEIDNPAFNVHL